MDNVKQWFSQYWMFAAVLVAVCIAAVFVFRAAGKAYKRYYERYRKQEAEIKRLVALKGKYATLTRQVIEEADENELLEGVALSYQLVLQKKEDMSAAFALLEEEQRNIYALDVFVQDADVKIFFRENGRELTQIIVRALCAIGLEEAAKQAEKVRIMFDETDETTSINDRVMQEVSKYFEQNDILTKIKQHSAKYIKNNIEKFA